MSKYFLANFKYIFTSRAGLPGAGVDNLPLQLKLPSPLGNLFRPPLDAAAGAVRPILPFGLNSPHSLLARSVLGAGQPRTSPPTPSSASTRSSIKEEAEEATHSETESEESPRKRSSSGSGDVEGSAFRQVKPKLKMSPTSVTDR